MAVQLGGTGQSSTDRLVATALRTRDRHEKLLLLRMIEVCDAIVERAPELAKATGFVDMWSAAATMAPVSLLASGQPLVDAWVGTAERLVRFGILERYPHAHPARHLKAFCRVLLSSRANSRERTGGEFNMGGYSAFQLLGGSRVLLGGPENRTETIVWSRDKTSLTVGRKDRDRLLEISLTDPTDFALSDPHWQLIVLPTVGQVYIDLWTPEYHRNRSCELDPAVLQRRVQQLFDELAPDVLRFVESVCHCIVGTRDLRGGGGATAPRPHHQDIDAAWTAGLIRVDGTDLAADAFLVMACRDLIERLLGVTPTSVFGTQSPGSDFQSLFVSVGARRLANELLNRDPDETLNDDDRKHWAAATDMLGRSESGAFLLRELGENPGGFTSSSQPDADLLEIKAQDLGWEDDALPQMLALRKTRRNAAFSINDFSLIDILTGDAHGGAAPRLAANGSEAAAFAVSAAAYAGGQFDDCVAALLRCLEFDMDVEEYWHLLAFALRYGGHHDEFNDIIFKGRRDRELLLRLRETGASAHA